MMAGELVDGSLYLDDAVLLPAENHPNVLFNVRRLQRLRVHANREERTGVTKIIWKMAHSVISWRMLEGVVPTSLWLQVKYARINLSQAASGMILQNHRRLTVSIFSVKKAAVKRVKAPSNFELPSKIKDQNEK
jgi:hypothetical protein